MPSREKRRRDRSHGGGRDRDGGQPHNSRRGEERYGKGGPSTDGDVIPRESTGSNRYGDHSDDHRDRHRSSRHHHAHRHSHHRHRSPKDGAGEAIEENRRVYRRRSDDANGPSRRHRRNSRTSSCDSTPRNSSSQLKKARHEPQGKGRVRGPRLAQQQPAYGGSYSDAISGAHRSAADRSFAAPSRTTVDIDDQARSESVDSEGSEELLEWRRDHLAALQERDAANGTPGADEHALPANPLTHLFERLTTGILDQVGEDSDGGPEMCTVVVRSVDRTVTAAHFTAMLQQLVGVKPESVVRPAVAIGGPNALNDEDAGGIVVLHFSKGPLAVQALEALNGGTINGRCVTAKLA